MRKAFSLVELSIVLVILGLLTGGILAGRSLIRASELRSVSADVQRYTSSINAFRDKYMGLPGDIPNAESFWGSASSCPNSTHTGTATCNGDNSGFINSYYYSNFAAYSSNLFEGFNAWQQMSNAGMIEGVFTGGYSSPHANPGTNIPPSKIDSRAGFILASIGSEQSPSILMIPSSGSASSGPGPINIPPTSPLMWNTIQSARVILYLSSGLFQAKVLTPEDAWNIDTKRDDGKPDSGAVQGGTKASTCFTSATSPSDYALTVGDKVCSQFFVIVP